MSLGCFFLPAAFAALLADDEDKLAPRLRAAWEKYSELQEVRAAYMARSELTGTVHAIERERADLIANIREHQVVVDAMPRLRNGASGRNSIHEGYVQELLMLRNQLTEMDRTLEELRFHMRELDELALGGAEQNGGRVKPTDRRDLLPEAQRLQKECQSAFAALKDAADAIARGGSVSREQAVRQVMADQNRAGSASQLCSPPLFLAAFKQFCAGKKPLADSPNRGSRPRNRRVAG
jgi:hypothetical protein